MKTVGECFVEISILSEREWTDHRGVTSSPIHSFMKGHVISQTYQQT